MMASMRTDVEVYSKTSNAWLLGKVTEVKSATVVTELVVPGTANKARKELPMGHQHIRLRAAESCGDRVADSTAGVLEEGALNDEELRIYTYYFKHCAQGESTAHWKNASRLLAHSGLPKKALKEVWVVGNPTLATSLDFTMFSRCCRLVAACQANQGPWERALVDGGALLRMRLAAKLAEGPPPQMPDFQRPVSG
eukprot:TRINITY_DN15012_c0_g1_i1.p1 TRINITY_DN15012_c0_g1~~TRINITY_DN15012_c0_g1_i1.p1  ORF type:complete len:196 (-),score=36.04 TRINITY_DN15012_c0_g1_i1:227-814(-)